MEYLELAKFIKEVGISIGVFVLCFWIVQFIVKRMAASLDALTVNMKQFTDNVRREHKEGAEHHKSIMEQHMEIMKGLGRINGYKD